MSEISIISYIMDFGKHRGQLIENVPRNYLNWCLERIEDGEFRALSGGDRKELEEAIEAEFALRDRSHITF